MATQQSVRINSGEKSGEPQHEALTFDFSEEGKKKMTPAELAMFQATITYVLSQPGCAFHLPTARDPKITKPSAAVLTTPQELANAEEQCDGRVIVTTPSAIARAIGADLSCES
jgi:hypothetical protein